MKNLLLISLLFVAGLLAFTDIELGDDNNNVDDRALYMTKTFKASSIKNVDVSTSGGGITVMGGESSEARVEVYVGGNGRGSLSESEIEERLEKYNLIVKMDGGTLICEAERKDKSGNWNWRNSLNISFKVYVPTKVATNLNTSGGGIKMANLNGDLKFRTSGGGLDLEDLRGEVKGSTSGGGIKMINCDDIVKVRTSGGGIDARDCDGEIDLSTSGGGIKLTNLNGNVEANTSGGGISVEDFTGDLDTSTSGGSIRMNGMNGNVKASTSGGEISASFERPGKYISLSTSAGNIDIDVPNGKGYDLDLSGNRVRMASSSNFSGTKKDDRVQGRLNGGGTSIKARASSGSISLN
jgi:DUF4097 and DUF4098 domain-containing protein YvlB